MNTHNLSQGTFAALTLSVLIPVVSLAQSVVTDDFTDSSAWGTPMLFSADSAVFVAGGRMNYTCTSALEGGGAIPRNTPLLPASQDWSMRVDVHLDPFELMTEGQF